MPTLTLGDRTFDLTDEILVLDAIDTAAIASIVQAGVVDLGTADAGSLAALRHRTERDHEPSEALMMRFESDQLAELAVAIVRGVRVVCAPATEDVTEVVAMLVAILDASSRSRSERTGPRRRR